MIPATHSGLRRRGVVLTPGGWQKYLQARQHYEFRHNHGRRLTLEQLSELTDLNTSTLTRIQHRRNPVDRSSLQQLFQSFALPLSQGDYALVDPARRERRSGSVQCRWDLGGVAAAPAALIGRATALTDLEQWSCREGAHLICVNGMAGSGKTALALAFAHCAASHFEAIVYRSLTEAPPLAEFLIDLLAALAVSERPLGVAAQLRCIVEALRTRRTLLLLDDGEAILAPGLLAGIYRPDREDYAELLQALATGCHDSCVLLIGRESPRDLVRLGGPTVRTLVLGGLSPEEGQVLMVGRGLTAAPAAVAGLVHHYTGNPRMLQVAAALLDSVCDSDLPFLLNILERGQEVPEDVAALLALQLARIAPQERELLYWLALDPASAHLDGLCARVRPLAPLRAIEGCRSLQERGLLQGTRTALSLSPALRSYLRQELLARLEGELCGGEVHLLDHLDLTPAFQGSGGGFERLTGRLSARHAGARAARNHLELLRERWRDQPGGYAVANLTLLIGRLPSDHGHLGWMGALQAARTV